MLGAEHPDTLDATANLANTYTNQGKLAEAEELQVWVVEANTRLNGKEHLHTLSHASERLSPFVPHGHSTLQQAIVALASPQLSQSSPPPWTHVHV